MIKTGPSLASPAEGGWMVWMALGVSLAMTTYLFVVSTPPMTFLLPVAVTALPLSARTTRIDRMLRGTSFVLLCVGSTTLGTAAIYPAIPMGIALGLSFTGRPRA